MEEVADQVGDLAALVKVARQLVPAEVEVTVASPELVVCLQSRKLKSARGSGNYKAHDGCDGDGRRI